ncbi:polyprenyl synthetase family protein [Ulvibacter litoralis]|uniref:Geranylgeranyl diphosphate synthase, type II n=1 Tax=Ulvibacter litoralis TaxID=227084 RepID=A0A1G7DPQ9_9FLAO|nr:polyprenyl synthetase family protein [Ulvibacter litoralis]GHC42789.1 isoprenyl synthetase [Ulvibacter litoralis]SDE53146.1 geranylgeranyl diphosphate synthase, type II [Ulvibacter litoralis]
MDILAKYSEALDVHLTSSVAVKEPIQLYEPIQYIVSLGGKRLRPTLTLLSCDFFGTSYEKAMNAALAIELFHNFSLIHDDIMDNAPLRRGEETVHEKWDLNTGILSGDAMLILAYQLFEVYDASLFRDLAKLFSKTALQVCEGQQYDVDFETRDDVTIPEYIKMIDYKTAVLIGAAMKMGAIVAGASESCKERIYAFGRNLGIAFQLQDDYLDAFGNPKNFGKQVGGDIITNKKTFLYLKALQNGTKDEAEELEHLFSINPKDPSDKIQRVTAIFKSTGASEATKEEIVKYTQKANEDLEKIAISSESKNTLREFGLSLMARSV